jgi:cytochrome c oxidase subunit 3
VHPAGSRPSDLPRKTHPLILGVVIFLSSELMLFAGFLTAYFDLRAAATEWPPPDVHLDGLEAALGTALLAFSSFTMWRCTHNLARNRFGRSRLWLGATIVLAVVFLAIAMHGWHAATFSVNTHAYGTLFFSLTGIHALHVAAGIVLLSLLFWGANMAAFNRDQRAGAEAIGLYWHFVMGVWILIWGSIYVLK